MARDPYKYFRIEGRELLDKLTALFLEVEKGQFDKGAVAKLLRLAHTLKGAARVVEQAAIAQAAHAIEDILAPYRESPVPLPKESAAEALRLLAQIGSEIDALQSLAEPTETVPRSSSSEWLDTIRVEVNEVEALLGSLAEIGVQVRTTRNEADQIKQARELTAAIIQLASKSTGMGEGSNGAALRSSAEELLTCLTRSERGLAVAVAAAERELGQCQERANRIRLLPVETLFLALTQAVREAARSLGKQAELKAIGGGIRLDADVLRVLQDALLHLVRNAVAHGIEDPAGRTAAGKSPIGKVELRVERRGSRISFICEDDGAGIDIAAIRREAVKKGAISDKGADSLGLQEAIHLVLQGGVSTSDKVSGTSGRGIGLEIVRDCVERLKGDIFIESKPGVGTSIELRVPASLSSVNAVVVESAGIRACLPLESVRQSLCLREQDIASTGASESVPFEDRALPFLSLSEVLAARRSPSSAQERKTAIVIRLGNSMAALGVEKLLGTRAVLSRALPSITGAHTVIAGASLDAEGNPMLVLDVGPLVEVIQKGRSEPARTDQRTRHLLIVDDSLTTRMVEQNILESAGYEVETASSAEEGLRMAHLNKPSLFLVDIEMPGMDGFEFISRVHNDPVLRDVPAITVSSKSSSIERRRAEEVGARAFFDKGEFDQARFLETVAHLCGVNDG